MSNLNGLTIALVGPLPPPEGGMANQARLLASKLTDNGINVHFVRTNDSYKPEWVKNIKVLRALFRLLFYFIEVWKASAKVKLFHVLSNSGWSWHLYSVPVIIIARIKKIPVIINYRGGEADAFFKKSWVWVKPAMKKATLITVPTAYLQQVFEKWGMQATIVPNIIDLEEFYPEAPTEKKSNKDLHIIVTRNLEKIYGNDIAIKAFAKISTQIKNAKLTIAGSGEEKKNLENLVKQLTAEQPDLAGKINFAGKLNRQQISKLYKSADIMLNASTVDNTPNSIIEALASGVIVVSSNVGGIPFLVENNKQAILVKENTAEMLANAALSVIKDDSLKKTLRSNGLELVQQFAWDSVREKLLNSYKKAL